jgi:hypothetical protein
VATAAASKPPAKGVSRQDTKGQEDFARGCRRSWECGAGRCPHSASQRQQLPNVVPMWRDTPATTGLSGETTGFSDVAADRAAQLQQTIIGEPATATAGALLAGTGCTTSPTITRLARSRRTSWPIQHSATACLADLSFSHVLRSQSVVAGSLSPSPGAQSPFPDHETRVSRLILLHVPSAGESGSVMGRRLNREQLRQPKPGIESLSHAGCHLELSLFPVEREGLA